MKFLAILPCLGLPALAQVTVHLKLVDASEVYIPCNGAWQSTGWGYRGGSQTVEIGTGGSSDTGPYQVQLSAVNVQGSTQTSPVYSFNGDPGAWSKFWDVPGGEYSVSINSAWCQYD